MQGPSHHCIYLGGYLKHPGALIDTVYYRGILMESTLKRQPQKLLASHPFKTQSCPGSVSEPAGLNGRPAFQFASASRAETTYRQTDRQRDRQTDVYVNT